MNAGALLATGTSIRVEAHRRFPEPAEVPTTAMLTVAALGLIVTPVSARLLVGGSETSLNVQSAYREVMGGLPGSVAVIVGALLIRQASQTWIGTLNRAVSAAARLDAPELKRK